MFVKLIGHWQLAIGISFHIGVACTERDGGAERVVDAGPDEQLLPFVPPVFTAVLHLHMHAPLAAKERMVTHIVPPGVVVVRMIIRCGRAEGETEGG
jgi:hypothetical protein